MFVKSLNFSRGAEKTQFSGALWIGMGVAGLPRGIRTPDPRLRRPMLYPTELWAEQNRIRKTAAEIENGLSDDSPFMLLVGVQGFEPWTPWSQTRCATGLRYFPIVGQQKYLEMYQPMVF